MRLFLAIFASLLLVLALGYYFFVRTEYTVLYSGMRPADASAVVAELDGKSIEYQLRDDGSTILVPVDEAASIRLAIIGSEVPLKGLVGFELFNKSDMGLTDFAQKINYQRALQGELSRTIMMMSDVENARVHLALPERSLFRGNRSEPKAAVTVIAAKGKRLHERRVVGIQRLVAAAVPDLALANVVVLDEVGRVISHSLEADDLLTPAMEEQSAVQRYYHARVRAAVANAMPGLNFEVRLLVQAIPGNPLGISGASVPTGEGPPQRRRASAGGHSRDFQLRLSIITNSALNPEDQERIRGAVVAAVGLAEETGDSLIFDVQSGLAPVGAPAAVETDVADAIVDRPTSARSPASKWQDWWIVFAAALGILFLLLRRSRERTLSTDEDDLVRRIRRQFTPQEGAADAGA